MPRTRTELDREQKVGEILELAERRLLDRGFEALSMAAIARDLGLSQNAIYWYFPSRGHLFVAVLERVLEEIVARKPRGQVELVERILWFTDQFAPLYALRPAMQDQARESPVVARFVKDLDDRVDRMLTGALRARVPEDELSTAVESFRATVAGAYAQRLSRRRRRELLAFVLGRLFHD
jgi:AcrR family transcriptional regulator